MRKIGLAVLSTFIALVWLVPSAADAKPKKKKIHRVAVYAEPYKRSSLPPEMTMYGERQLFKKLGQENPKLVDMIKKCEGELFCLATLIKARDERLKVRIKEEAVNRLLLDVIAAVLPAAKEYLATLREDAAKSEDSVYAGKFAVAVEQVSKASEIFADLRQYTYKMQQAAHNEDKADLWPVASEEKKQ